MSAARAGIAGAVDEGDPADAVLRALADPHRRQILRLVRGGELAAGQIASHFDATQQAVSHHLQVLAKAGLLSERRDGVRRLYALDPQALDPVRDPQQSAGRGVRQPPQGMDAHARSARAALEVCRAARADTPL
jgi:DNA-binding transcriptional ArsR family regulator